MGVREWGSGGSIGSRVVGLGSGGSVRLGSWGSLGLGSGGVWVREWGSGIV